MIVIHSSLYVQVVYQLVMQRIGLPFNYMKGGGLSVGYREEGDFSWLYRKGVISSKVSNFVGCFEDF